MKIRYKDALSGECIVTDVSMIVSEILDDINLQYDGKLEGLEARIEKMQGMIGHLLNNLVEGKALNNRALNEILDDYRRTEFKIVIPTEIIYLKGDATDLPATVDR
jgi:uncharacterized protein (DUF39 family)